MRKTLHTSLVIALLLHAAAPAMAQRPREYTPSPVTPARWNAPGSANPFIPGYFADPTIRRFGDTWYLYATTDGTGNGYGPAQVWVSHDFVNWKNLVMNWPTTEVVWAPDVVQLPDGRFRYFYCEPCNINIGESDSPIGPWHNILGREDAVMVPDRYVHNVITLDPQLFTDDDGSQYLYFTTWGIYKGFGCGVARLRGGHFDLASLPQAVSADARRWSEQRPFPIAADSFFTEKRLIPNTELRDIFEAPFVFKRDGIYYFTYSSGSCHTDTYRVQYATSTVGPMGPFEYQGELLTTNEDQTVHGPGHHSILEQNGRYYIIYHRHNLPRSVHGFNRQVCIDELQFGADGRILPITPTHDAAGVSLIRQQRQRNLAYGATVTASSHYGEEFQPAYAVDDNNATLWRAAATVWSSTDGQPHPQWLQIDLGRPTRFNEVWTQFEYATFYYQYRIETSLDGTTWALYADRTRNVQQGSPMIDRGSARARYLRLTITDTQKNGHMPAVWNIKVWKKAPTLPSIQAEANDAYPGMHQPDVSAAERAATPAACIHLDVAQLADGHTAPFDVTTLTTAEAAPWTFQANKPIRARVKDGRWALFLNGTQHLTSTAPLPAHYRYNAPYTISAWALQTKVGPVSTLVQLSPSHADLATTALRLGSDPATGLIQHNGSFESCGAPREIQAAEGAWHHWLATFDGWMERIFLDGHLIHEQNNFLMVRPDGPLTIGADAAGANNFMGYLSQLTISPVATTAEEARRLYEQQRTATLPSLGDDDFEEIDPDSRFQLSPAMRPVLQQPQEQTLSATTSDFNDAPWQNGAVALRELTGDFVCMVTVADMEGLSSHAVKGYNEGGLLLADSLGHFYQLGVFPLYNCGNMLTLLSPRGRPQFPNYRGYDFDPILQFERRGDQLFARTSSDGQSWTNMPGSPITVNAATLTLGIYQTTYTPQPSWVKLSNLVVYQ